MSGKSGSEVFLHEKGLIRGLWLEIQNLTSLVFVDVRLDNCVYCTHVGR